MINKQENFFFVFIKTDFRIGTEIFKFVYYSQFEHEIL